jgi:hypothetical protein
MTKRKLVAKEKRGDFYVSPSFLLVVADPLFRDPTNYQPTHLFGCGGWQLREVAFDLSEKFYGLAANPPIALIWGCKLLHSTS